MAKVSLASQMKAVEALTSGRVTIGNVSQSQRSLLIEHLQSVAATLRLVQRHEIEIRSIVEKRKEGRA